MRLWSGVKQKRKYEQINALCTLREIASEEVEKGLHLGVECLGCSNERVGERWTDVTHLLGSRVLDGGDETTDLVAHGLGGNAGSGGLEVDVTATANAGVEGIGAWSKSSHCAGRR